MVDMDSEYGTILGADAKFKGDLSFDSSAKVLGSFEGVIKAKGKIFIADDGNYGTVQTQLQGYSGPQLVEFQNQINDGRTLYLPQSGALVLNQWQGLGYITRLEQPDGSLSLGMIIGGGYSGGFVSFISNIIPSIVSTVVNTILPTVERVIDFSAFIFG